MDVTFLIPALALFTLISLAVFALISRERTLHAMKDPMHQKSTLAADAPNS